MFQPADGAPHMFRPLQRPSETVEPGQLGIFPSLSPHPHCRPSAPGLAPSASIFSSSFYPSEKTEETLEKSIQLKEARGWRRCYIPPPINIQYPKCGGGPEKWHPRAKWCPSPPTSLIYIPPSHTALEELGSSKEEAFHRLR